MFVTINSAFSQKGGAHNKPSLGSHRQPAKEGRISA
jgi:hypothetical protein